MKSYLPFLLLIVCFGCDLKVPIPTADLKAPFELKENYSASYEEGMAFYDKLDGRFTKCKVIEVGETDSGKPLSLAILSKNHDFTLNELVNSDKPIFFINNAIHPGEPCGVDATMLFYRDVLANDSLRQVLDHINIVAIPYYNISGALNRNSTTRANQNGPVEYGFRGNIKNLDLNRDFVKADSKNAKTFNQVFSKLQPEVFIDNHTTNGADYQYTMTLINTLPEKLPASLGGLLKDNMLPFLYSDMAARGWDMTPYVSTYGSIPDQGLVAFNDLPRYSNGYAALHHSLAFTGETHMLKPFKDRVWSNYELLHSMSTWMANHVAELTAAHDQALEATSTEETEVLHWQLDTTQFEDLTFKGYKAEYKPSEITGRQRLNYNRDSSFTKTIKYYNSYRPREDQPVAKPQAFYIPQAWTEVLERLRWNGVEVIELDKAVEVEGQYKYINNYETVNQPYESHYLHFNVTTRSEEATATFEVGDFKVPLGQGRDKYIMASLAPEAPDSYFAWNFFDGILMQKEYYSPYLFEDRAVELLDKHPDWKVELDSLIQNDPSFTENSRTALNWVYKKSDHYEKTHLRYPVFYGQKETIVPVNVFSEQEGEN
ncbi:MAG: hypothetical protein KTR13_04995 [Saprospiraceae bacterium]|nr:hypothetical protein [Saprospiraceae bacterium]